jgi:hypothetical protein
MGKRGLIGVMNSNNPKVLVHAASYKCGLRLVRRVASTAEYLLLFVTICIWRRRPHKEALIVCWCKALKYGWDSLHVRWA